MRRYIVIIVTVVAVTFAVMWLGCARPRSASGQKCTSNFAQIGKLFYRYEADHGGNFPSSWQASYDYLASSGQDANPRLFVCRRTGQQPGPTNQVDNWCSFVIVPNLTTNSPMTRVIACCRPEHHDGKGANVLFVDGSVCWYATDEFYKLLKEQGITLPKKK